MSDKIVKGLNITKEFGGVAVVKDIDFWVKKKSVSHDFGTKWLWKDDDFKNDRWIRDADFWAPFF